MISSSCAIDWMSSTHRLSDNKRDSLASSHAPFHEIISLNPPRFSKFDNRSIAFLMWRSIVYCALNPVWLAKIKLFHLSCCFLHFCWAACIQLTSGLIDCICSTEEGCEISLDLSWYFYTIWNETLSQGESNYLSSFGPWICNIFFQ